MYSNRQAKILLICIEQNGYITYQTISEKLQISKRTIMRELSNINLQLKVQNLELYLKKGKGLKIKGKEEDIEKFKMSLIDTHVDFSSKEERQELLCLELLNTKEIQKIVYYAKLFDVSQATISNDLEDLSTFFRQNHLQLIRRPGLGVQVTGKEEELRQALSLLINKSVGHRLVNVDFDRYNIKDILEELFSTSDSNMAKLLDQEILQDILEVLKDNKDSVDLSYMAKNSYIGLLIHLMIAVKRIKQGEQIKNNSELEKLDYDTSSFEKAKQIIQYLSKRFNICFPRSELLFITIHLESAKKAHVTKEESDYQIYLPIIERMISIFKQHGFFLQDDYELYQGIVAHLKPAMIRLEYGLPIYNPMLKKIKEGYTLIFDITKKACEEITKMYGYDVNDDEVGYLSLHFGAAIERHKKTIKHLRNIKIGIVCSSGIGMSALLLARLRQILDSNVQLQPLSITEVGETDCEIIVSTFILTNFDAITISPLLSNKDIYKIQQEIKIKRENSNTKEITTSNNIDLVETLSDIQNLMESLDIYIYDKKITKDKLIINISNKIVCRNNQKLQQELFKREELGSNVYHEFRFALFHCSTHVVDTCQIKIIRPNDLEFIDPTLKNIKIVLIMLVPKDNSKAKQNMMSYITTMILEDEAFFNSLTVSSLEIVKEAIHEILKQYLLQYLQEAK